jgi:hypothetical protein
MRVKPTETVYKGRTFRHPLAARWAVCFDNLGLGWQYEPERFTLPGGRSYQPEFFIPEWNLFLDVEPDLPYGDVEEHEGTFRVPVGESATGPLSTFLLVAAVLALRRADGADKRGLVMLCGSPGVPFLHEYRGRWRLGEGAVALTFHPPPLNLIGIAALSEALGDGRFDLWPYYLNGEPSDGRAAPYESAIFPRGRTDHLYIGQGRSFASHRLQAAYRAARSARFEHGN